MQTEGGYPMKEFIVKTSDGYILKIFRIPGSYQRPSANGKTVVFFQHGLLSGIGSFSEKIKLFLTY